MSDITVSAVIGSALLAYVPSFIRNGYTYAYAEATGRGKIGEMNTNPRTNLPHAIDHIEDQEVQSFLQRSFGAHVNQLESLPFLFGGLSVATLYRVPTKTIDRCALVYLVSTGVYTWLYMSKPSALKGRLRSVAFSIRSGSMYYALGAALASARGRPTSWLYPASVVGLMVAVVDVCYGLSMWRGGKDGKKAVHDKDKALGQE